MFTKKQLLTKGLLSVAPHMFSVIPFGIVCGAIGIALGFSPILVYAMSIIIFGGASQIYQPRQGSIRNIIIMKINDFSYFQKENTCI